MLRNCKDPLHVQFRQLNRWWVNRVSTSLHPTRYIKAGCLYIRDATEEARIKIRGVRLEIRSDQTTIEVDREESATAAIGKE